VLDENELKKMFTTRPLDFQHIGKIAGQKKIEKRKHSTRQPGQTTAA